MSSTMTRFTRTTPTTATLKRTSFSRSTISRHHSSSYHSSSFTTSTKETSSSYTFTPTIPNVKNPYIIHHKGKNGSIFIILGSVIIALIVGLILARFWYWMKNRKATNDEKLLDDYYGGTFEKSMSGVLAYDSSYFDNEKSAFNLSFESSPESKNSHRSQSSTSSDGNKSYADLNHLTTQPGRALRGTSQIQIPTVRRNSFISPLNELINESNCNQLSNSNEINTAFSASTDTALDSGTFLHSRNKSGSGLFNTNSPTLNKVCSTHLDSVEHMVNQSLIDLDKFENKASHEQLNKPKRSRPASQVLDMLVLQDLKEL